MKLPARHSERKVKRAWVCIDGQKIEIDDDCRVVLLYTAPGVEEKKCLLKTKADIVDALLEIMVVDIGVKLICVCDAEDEFYMSIDKFRKDCGLSILWEKWENDDEKGES